MKIGIAARGLSVESGGVKQYIESLTSALLKIDNTNKYYIFYNLNNSKGKFPKANEIILNSSSKLFWDYYLIPKAIKDYELDIMLFPKNILPFFINCKSVIVIHDLAFFMSKLNAYPLNDTIYMHMMIKSSVKRANHIITVSENTKQDIIKYLGVEESMITVTHLASNEKYRKIEDEIRLNEIKKKYGLNDKFIFYCGSLSPRKNMIRLLMAFDTIRNKIPHKLVLTGGRSWNDKTLNNLIHKIGDDVIKLGFVPDEDTPLLYNLADLFVYPSLYEGFGLPTLEAMACGCPVFTSNISSIPEVVGDAGKMVDPYNIDEMAKAMYDILTDDELKDDMVKRGQKRIKKFSWEKCAKESLYVLERIYKNE
ncbi:MAG: glycosyltransferase family 4 protein [Methanosarcinales archaeon]|nr:glycosyltransferase family 4 protein [Methanosarcinales archaeon]